MSPKEPDVSGWTPDFRPAEEQIAVQQAALRELLGHHVVDTWVVWDLAADSWFAGLPVVVQMANGSQLEVCWERLDGLSITWNTIDVNVLPEGWVDCPLAWRRQALPPLSDVTGAKVQSVAKSRFLFTTTDVHDPDDVRSIWLTTGLWISTESGGGVHIFNALDENGVSASAPTHDPQHECKPI